MNVPQTLIFARQGAESMMTDTGVITRQGVGSATEIDPFTGLFPDETTDEVIYDGKCFLLERREQNPSAKSVGGDFPYVEMVSLHIPADGPMVKVQDIFTLTSSLSHPQDVGQRYRITFFNPGTHLKNRRMQMEVITG